MDIEEVIRKKNEFINSIEKFLIESNVRTKETKKMMNELSIQAAKNIEELSRLL